MSEAGNTEELNLGCDEAGEDCFGKVITYGGKSAIAGGLVGSAEGCFLSPVPNSTTPMLVRALGLIARRSMLFGIAGGSFGAGACLSAGIRDKDDHLNAAVGGALVGSVFGFKNRSWGLGIGLAVGFAFIMGTIKYRFGTYIPPLPLTSAKDRRGPPPLDQASNGD
ncbi:uncharacterized protein LOC135335520 [Halichondria panicea]|uniref:uncharacterized protein LOC135335520 n=1 Tax=Halichondria panicea TaxID=6063 RepID=UPI00312B40B9